MHRLETHSPKHTDSQVPLYLNRYDADNESSDSEDLKMNGRDNYIIADYPSDSDAGISLYPKYQNETDL